MLAVRQNNSTSFYETDALGSVVRLVSGGDVVGTLAYDSFGRILNSGRKSEGEGHDGNASANQPYAFQGREFDRESGLYYFRARCYDPQIGRFITQDPIGFGGGQNFYRFVGNNSVKRVDPKGLVNDFMSMYLTPGGDVTYSTFQELDADLCAHEPAKAPQNSLEKQKALLRALEESVLRTPTQEISPTKHSFGSAPSKTP